MNQVVKIAGHSVGAGHPAFIIAEAGSNHNQDLNMAYKLIDAAAAAGANAVKFQLFKAEVLNPVKDKVFDIIKACEFPRAWIKDTINYASKKNIIFMATPFDHEAVDLLAAHGAPAFKIASSEVANYQFLRYVASKGRPIILSTGMSDMADVYDAMDVIRHSGNKDLILLQCSALYPVPPAKVNLRVMDTLRETFGVPSGFSDHTLGILFPAVAVARGACVIEKHFTLDRNLPGPDHSYAIEPDELTRMVKDIRDVEASLGDAEKKFLPEERVQTRRVSLFASRELKAGQVLSIEDIVIHRPATGLSPRFLNALIGSKLTKAVAKDSPMAWDMV